jgi:hypothetical protein
MTVSPRGESARPTMRLEIPELVSGASMGNSSLLWEGGLENSKRIEYFKKVLSDKRRTRSIVTRAHAPRHAAAPEAPLRNGWCV